MENPLVLLGLKNHFTVLWLHANQCIGIIAVSQRFGDPLTLCQHQNTNNLHNAMPAAES